MAVSNPSLYAWIADILASCPPPRIPMQILLFIIKNIYQVCENKK
jgi:hypothetical protein